MGKRIDNFAAAVRGALPRPWGRLIYQKVIAMADQLTQLNDQIARLTKTVADTQARVAQTQAALQQAIADLQNHPAAPDLAAQIAALQAANDALGTIDPASDPAAA